MSPADLAGWLGAATLLGAYGTASAGLLPAGSRLYQALNGLGSVGLGAVAVSHRAWPSVALNAVWLLIAVASLARPSSRPRPAALRRPRPRPLHHTP